MDPLAEIRSALSDSRLRLAFRANATEADELTFARALYNAALCEALYPTLHHLEIALRNNLDRVIAANYPASAAGAIGMDGLSLAGCWLDAAPGLVGRWEQGEVQRVKRKLLREGKSITPHRLIAGLSLGFLGEPLHPRVRDRP